MPRNSGTVSKIDIKKTQSGKTYYRVNVNGTWYSAWERPSFSEGQVIEFDEIIKGDFKNLANAAVVEGGGEAVAPVRTSRPNGSFDPDKEGRIVRQNAFKTATALVSAWYEKEKDKKDLDTLLTITKEVASKIFVLNMYGYVAGLESEAPAEQQQSLPFFE